MPWHHRLVLRMSGAYIAAATQESDWLASKLKEANDDSLLYHLAFIWLAKKAYGDGYQNAIDQALEAVREP